MTTTKSIGLYLGSVAEHLYVQGMSRRRIGQHLAEMSSHLTDTGRDPTDEYGDPEAYARALVEADGRVARPVGVRALGVFAGMLSLLLGTRLLLAGTGPAVLEARGLPMLVVFALMPAGASTVWSARMRDGLQPGSANSQFAARAVLAQALGAALVAGFLLWVANHWFQNRTLGMSTLPGWPVGLGAVAVGLAVLATVTGLPRFPAGSSLRASRFRRRIRF